jgi:hypothetical protein
MERRLTILKTRVSKCVPPPRGLRGQIDQGVDASVSCLDELDAQPTELAVGFGIPRRGRWVEVVERHKEAGPLRRLWSRGLAEGRSRRSLRNRRTMRRSRRSGQGSQRAGWAQSLALPETRMATDNLRAAAEARMVWNANLPTVMIHQLAAAFASSTVIASMRRDAVAFTGRPAQARRNRSTASTRRCERSSASRSSLMKILRTCPSTVLALTCSSEQRPALVRP